MTRTPNINITLVATTHKGQFVKIGDKVDTEKYAGCSEVFIVGNGETIFAGYAVPYSGIDYKSCYDVPVNLYYLDDRTHIIGFQTASLDYNGKTYSFMA